MKAEFTTTYSKKQQALEFAVSSENGSRRWATHLGEFLRSLGTTESDCLEAMGQAELPVASVPETDEWDDWGIASLPADLSGQVVVDVGGYTGFMAKAALDRGAARAACIDNMQYLAYTLPTFPYGWRRPVRYEGVEYIFGSLMDFGAWPRQYRQADLVVCFNLIYHVPDPIGALAALRGLTRQTMLIQTSFRDGDDPVWWWNPDESGTIFFTPTCPALVATLRYVGFTSEEVGRRGNRVIYRCH